MQQDQQGGGEGASGSQYHHHHLQQQHQHQHQQQQQQHQVVEEASPISSRPPAAAGGSFDEMLPVTAGDEDLVGSGGNRWPRQETLALLKIRSDMDVVFRDATLKGPLWDDVSRKLGELGYTRSAKKCKEKFENVQKYYKRTKETRAGRQDGKSYKFFSQLEALHTTTNPPLPTTITTTSNPTMPISSSLQTQPIISQNFPTQPPVSLPIFPPTVGISFSSNSSSSSSSTSDDDTEGDEFEAEQSNPSTSQQPPRRKRKRVSRKGGSGNSNDKMMIFFEGLMKELMQKQEIIQQRFIDTIEKREKDRMIREEAWKRQEMARINRENELIAKDRAIAASRDAAVIDFLQKITGHVIQLPTVVTPINSPLPQPSPPAPNYVAAPTPVVAPPTPVVSVPPVAVVSTPPATFSHNQTPKSEQPIRQMVPVSSESFMAIPVQQIPPQDPSSTGGGSGSGGFDQTSSRWPKVEVLALIKIRSGLEGRYQEAGPKGPLWEEVSAGMLRMGYKRNPKRCKEKWENINKYFKKVKESNKTRPEDAKTCPYFHELDALYRRKILGGVSGGGDGSSGSSFGNQSMVVHQQNMVMNSQEQDRRNMPAPQVTHATNELETKKGDSSTTNVQGNNRGFPGTLFEQGSNIVKNDGGHRKPEDTMKELIEQQQRHHHHQQQQLMTNDYDRAKGLDHIKEMDLDDDESYDDDDEEESEEDMKMDYKIEFQQKQNGAASPSNRGGNGAPSFPTMVQ